VNCRRIERIESNVYCEMQTNVHAGRLKKKKKNFELRKLNEYIKFWKNLTYSIKYKTRINQVGFVCRKW